MKFLAVESVLCKDRGIERQEKTVHMKKKAESQEEEWIVEMHGQMFTNTAVEIVKDERQTYEACGL